MSGFQGLGRGKIADAAGALEIVLAHRKEMERWSTWTSVIKL
jgi:hypothetical protein